MFGGERAQSEVLGTVLLLGLTVTVVGSTVALGGAALDDSQTRADLQRAEGAMTQLDSKASLVAHGESPSQRASIGTNRGRVSIDDDAGRMIITENDSGEILNESLTALVYERDGTQIAYQGGGVWRNDGGGAYMISEPEFHYRGNTLTVPLVTVDDDAEVNGGDLLVTADGVPQRGTGENPITENVTITVTGDYYEGWAAFFEARTDSRVVERNADSVTVTLQTVFSDDVPQSLSVVGSSELDLESIDSLYADSYDSAGVGPSETNDSAVIAAAGDIDSPQGGRDEYITIKGDLLARGNIQPNPSGIQNGDHPINVSGTVTEGAEIDDPNPVDGYLLRVFAEYEDRYSAEPTTTYSSWSGVPNPVTDSSTVADGLDIDGTTESYRVEGTEIDASADGDLSVDSGGQVTLAAGNDRAGFRFDDLTVQSGELVLDTTDGDVDLYVEDDVTLGGEESDGATLTVVGDGAVRLYAAGDVSLQQHTTVNVESDAELRVFHDDTDGDVNIGSEDGGEGVAVSTGPNEPADSFWLFSNADDIKLDGSDAPIDLTGVVYAPNAKVDSAEGDITIRGAFVVDSFDELDGVNLTVRYDEALATAAVFDDVEDVPTIKHLHVSTQKIRIESD